MYDDVEECNGTNRQTGAGGMSAVDTVRAGGEGSGAADPSDPCPGSAGGGRGGRFPTPTRRGMVAWGIFAVALVVYVIVLGIPYSTDDLLLWIAAALFCACVSDLRRWRQGIIRDWLPLYLVLALYSLLRGYASHLWFQAHWRPELRFDEWIGGGVPLTVRLQDAIYRANDPHVWDYLIWCTYMTHFFASFLVAAVLWWKDHDRFRRFVPLFVGLTLAGYVTYVLYPAMPPWMVAANGDLAPVARIVPMMWDHVGVHGAGAIFEGGSQFDNDVAAVPSLHAAYPLLICLFFWGRARWRARVVLAAYPAAMAFSLVYGAEHFVFDIFLGWTYAIVTFVVGSTLLDRWEVRRQARLDARAAAGEAPERAGASAAPGGAGSAAAVGSVPIAGVTVPAAGVAVPVAGAALPAAGATASGLGDGTVDAGTAGAPSG